MFTDAGNKSCRSRKLAAFLSGVGLLAFAPSLTAWSAGAERKTAKPHIHASDVERALALDAVQNLIGRYGFYHLANMFADERYAGLFANGDPGLKIQLSSRGIWEGPDAAKRMLHSYDELTQSARAGGMSFHPAASPVIEVAGDGETARGVWLSPGAEGGVVGGQAQAAWVFVKYCADFKKVNGEWRIWHMLAHGVLVTPYDKPWTEGQRPALPPKEAAAVQQLPPDRPSNPPSDLYTTHTEQKLVPEPPLPYETWDDAMSCVK